MSKPRHSASLRADASRREGRVAPPALRQLLVDVTNLALYDRKTGIQRVVRNVMRELLAHPPAGFQVEPVYAHPERPGFLYARQFLHRLGQGPDVQDEPMSAARGDVFLGLDLNHEAVLIQPETFQALRRAGVRVCSLVYDLLPILLPHAFPGQGSALLHAPWLSRLAEMDGLICISKAVADETLAWLEVQGPRRKTPLPVGWFHLGADLGAFLPTRGVPPEAEGLLMELRKRPTFLMVATLEPRKGHRQVLEAFDRLWARGVDANLLFVGGEGWSVEKLVHRIRHHHPERNQRLFWIEGASDEYLEQLYDASSCLIAASEGEGFGLPLIEAAEHGLPILARDIPVFREVAGDGAFYFAGPDPEVLADRVAEWLARAAENRAPDSRGIRRLTWEESTRDLMAVLLGGRWYRHWVATGRRPQGSVHAHPRVEASSWERTIGVDGRTLSNLGSTQQGIGHYTVHHLQALAALTPRWRYRLFLDTPELSNWALDRLRSLPNIEFSSFGAFRAEDHDLVHVPDLLFVPNPILVGPAFPAGTPLTVTFYDLIPLLLRERYLDRWPQDLQDEYAERLDALKQSRAQVLTCSEHTRQDLIAHLSLPETRLDSILAGLNKHPGAPASPETIQRVRSEWGLEDPFFLVVGALDDHKRFDLSLQAFAEVRRSQVVQLVVVGSLDSPAARAWRDRLRTQGVQSVVFTGFLPRPELECLYRSATALLFPSDYEGFGLPVLEAMACGCPVITTTSSSLPEVAGDAALMIPPGDAAALAKGMLALLGDESLRQGLKARGVAQAGRFSWESVARETLRVWKGLWESVPSTNREGLAAGGASPSVVWEGSQFVWHSLAHVNRQISLGLLREETLDLCLIPYEADQFRPEDHPAFLPLAARVNRPPAGPVGVHVRHQWPPRFSPPRSGCWVMIQPWEFGGLPQAWVRPMVASVDEIWVYTSWLRDRYLESGVPEDKVVVISLGVDTTRFCPEGPRFALKTRKPFRFLYVGGAIYRKGFDVLLRAYRRAFTAADDVCLVIKAQGGGVYSGSELQAQLESLRTDPLAPEVEFLQQDLSEADLSALYRSCHAFVMPYRGEGFGLPIAEAMASGLPVIVTGRGAAMDFTQGDWAYRIPSQPLAIPRVDDLLPGPAGFWLEEPDEAFLAECLSGVALHPEEARAKGALARAYAETNLSWEGPVKRVAERVRILATRQPLRFRAEASPPPTPVATALLFTPDWTQSGWVEVVVSYLMAFTPGDPVALVLLPPAEGPGLSVAEAEQRVVAVAQKMGRADFPDIFILGPGDDLAGTLKPYLIRESIPPGRGATAGLCSLAGLKFSQARRSLAQG
ncbi:glycosyltransferase [Geothrix sp.]|uniref:glycosyltransferase n=1 Tax=Geothrix sp. TaxID=1962974 RepID=UPI0025C72466|nr:glycosyltransferase [Geothrix sp.]